jgi:D-glycero-D-manno-heptose 1,7-bisphosphate phosphatase
VGVGDDPVGAARDLVAGVFLDRDGVITEPVRDPRLGTCESPYRAADVALVAGAAAALRELRAMGFVLIGASNQPAAAKGSVALRDLRAVHERTVALLAAERAELDDWRYCLHHPDAVAAELAECACRKPRPGLLLSAARDHRLDLSRSWMIGDSDSDVLAGQAAGARTVLLAHPRTAHRRTGAAVPTLRASQLSVATRLLAAYAPGTASTSLRARERREEEEGHRA